MRFSIIINTHNQIRFIKDCINSCINQDFYDYEIIVTDTSDFKINKEILRSKKIKYFHIKQKSNYPVMNQMHQVLFGFNKSKGKYICLLDGDDKFAPKKLKELNEIVANKKIYINQDLPSFFSKDKILGQDKFKKYKNNEIFKKIFIEWPQVTGTSTITVKREILKKFFIKNKPFNWKYLAIDVQLVLFCDHNFKINNELTKITLKRKHDRNLDDTFSNFFSKSFWKRRKMQHELNYFIRKKRKVNFDFLVTKFVNFFF